MGLIAVVVIALIVCAVVFSKSSNEICKTHDGVKHVDRSMHYYPGTGNTYGSWQSQIDGVLCNDGSYHS